MSKRGETGWSAQRPLRRRVSRLRAFFGLFTLVLLGGVTLAYFHVTDEDRLRAYAEEWLHEFSGGEVHIEHVQFDLFRGLDLKGVTLATPEAERFDSRDNSLAGRTFFRARSLFLQLRPFSAITGDLVVPEIVATDPEVTLIHRLTDDARNWQVLLGQRPKKRSKGPLRLPVLRLRNLRVVQQQLDEKGRSIGAMQTLWADAQPLREGSETYDLRIVRVFEPDSSGQAGREEGRLAVNMRTMVVAGSVPSMSVDDLATTAPAHILRELDVLGLQGFVRAESIKFDPDKGGEATLVLRDVGLSVPINDEEEPLPVDERFIQFSQVGGTVQVRDGQATLDVRGRFRDSPVSLKGTVTFGSDGFTMEDLGFDATVVLSGVMLPTNDEQSTPAERRFVNRWFRLHEFVADYDPRGRADFTLHFRKTPGKDKGIAFVDGMLVPNGVSARYFRFPYRLYDLAGAIHFRPDGRIELREFGGTHGRGRAVINGLVDGYVSQGLDVSVKAEGIDLDGDLTRCLDERDRELIRLMNATARMNIGVQLHRDPKPHGLPVWQNPWKTTVDVDFLDGTVKPESLPYPLAGLGGRMRIEGGGFELNKVHASRGEAQVEASGRVQRGDAGPARVDLKLDARKVVLDEVFRESLSGNARATYDRIAPRGRVDVRGRVFTATGAAEMGYDLDVSLADGELNLPETKARLADVRADVSITPEQLGIRSLEGRFGGSPLAISGRVGARPGEKDLSVHVTSDHLLLDESLRAALPAEVQAMWETVRPAGLVRVDLTYEVGKGEDAGAALAASSPTGSEPFSNRSPILERMGHAAEVVETRPAGAGSRYAAAIEAMDCTAQLAEFPLALEGVSGRFVLTPGRVKMEKVSARHEGTKFELDGVVKTEAERYSGEMSLHVHGIDFSESLRKAVPGRIRRLWYDVKPTGKADVTLDRLAFSRGPEGDVWSAEGAADLDHLSLQIGTALSDVSGHVSGRGGVGKNVFADVDLALSQARVDDRLVTNAKAHMSRPADDTRLRITGFQSGFYQGLVMGELEVNYASGRPRFGLSLSARGVSLEQFLNATRKPGEPPVTAKGTVEGTLGLGGRFGDPTSRRGGGTVFIRQAQMAKIPMIFSIFKLVHGVHDDNAFDDARFAYAIDGEDLLLHEIDLRGKALSLVGAGQVHVPTEAMDLTLLVGSPLHLPRIEVLSELVEGVASELLQVHVEGTLEQPQFRAEVVKSVKKALDAVFSARRKASGRAATDGRGAIGHR